MNRRRLFMFSLIAVGMALLLFGLLSEAEAQDGGKTPTGDDSYCLLCHQQPDFVEVLLNLDNYVVPPSLDNSVHGIHNLDTPVGCVECHTDMTYPHTTVPDMSNVCTDCHSEQAQALSDGTHGAERFASGLPSDLACTACHGSHEVHPIEDMSCSTCHVDELPAFNNVLNVSLTECETCHETTIHEWESSAHGEQQLACQSCHLSHEGELRFETPDQLCLNCHDQDRDEYIHLSHVEQSCENCHWHNETDRTAHVLGESNQSTGHDAQVEVTTCVNCHSQENIVLTSGEASLNEHPFVKANEELENIEAEVEEQKDRSESISRVRIVQGLVVGLALGAVLMALVYNYQRKRQLPPISSEESHDTHE